MSVRPIRNIAGDEAVVAAGRACGIDLDRADDIIFFDLDQPLYDKLLQELGVVLSSCDDSALGSSLRNKCLQKFITKFHLLDTAGTNLSRTGDTFLNSTVLFFLGKFILDVELSLVDQCLFFQVEIVFSLKR